MSSLSPASNNFDWNAYQKTVAARFTPSIFDNTSKKVRALASAMLVGAAALAIHVARLKLTLAPTILVYSTASVVTLIALRILFSQTYLNAKAHFVVLLLKSFLKQVVSEQKGLVEILEENSIASDFVDVIWAHIKHRELSLTYPQFHERNGDHFFNFLTDEENKLVGRKFLTAYIHNSTPTNTIEKIVKLAKHVTILDDLAKSKPFNVLLSKRIKELDFDNLDPFLAFLKENSLLPEAVITLVKATRQKIEAAKTRKEQEKISSEQAYNLAETARKEKYERLVEKSLARFENQSNPNRALVQKFKEQKMDLEKQLRASLDELNQLLQQQELYQRQLADREQFIANYVKEAESKLASVEVPSSVFLLEENIALGALRNEIANLDKPFGDAVKLEQARKAYVKRFTQFCKWKTRYDAATQDGRIRADFHGAQRRQKFEADAVESYNALPQLLTGLKAQILQKQEEQGSGIFAQRTATIATLSSKILEKTSILAKLSQSYEARSTKLNRKARNEHFQLVNKFSHKSGKSIKRSEKDIAASLMFFRDNIETALGLKK